MAGETGAVGAGPMAGVRWVDRVACFGQAPTGSRRAGVLSRHTYCLTGGARAFEMYWRVAQPEHTPATPRLFDAVVRTFGVGPADDRP